jgi:hypothetical protein
MGLGTLRGRGEPPDPQTAEMVSAADVKQV